MERASHELDEVAFPAPSARGIRARLATRSPVVEAMLALVGQVALTNSTALLVGETGTGKGLVARLIHALSRRADRPFVTVQCAVSTPSLVEDEIFGHARGGFGGARAARSGQVQRAAGGTLFIDQIADLSLAAQGRLVGLLEGKEYRRLGDPKTRRADVRVVAAARESLGSCVRERVFRADLLHRLDVTRIEVPALRDRPVDIPYLAAAILNDLAHRHGRDPLRLTPAALEALTGYAWPGNIRELVNVLERTVVLAPKGMLDVDLLPEDVQRSGT